MSNAALSTLSPAVAEPDMFYMLPKDGKEISRLDMQHFLLQKVFRKNFLAPLNFPVNILDNGTGTGRWMLETAQQFPLAQIYGLDLDLPTLSLPENCTFTQGDLLDGLPFANEMFDFVHQRMLILGVPLDNWPGVINELIRVTRRQGWLELVECNLRFSSRGPFTDTFISWLDKASALRGIDIGVGTKIASLLTNAGLSNVTEHKQTIPLGSRGGHAGTMLLADFGQVARQALRPSLLKSLSLDPQEYDATVEHWIDECNTYHTSCDFYLVDAQKF